MNYNVEMEKILEEIKESNITPKLLLHSCCAPCSSHVISVLTNYFDITIIYYNPNIETFEEYEKRKQEEIRFINEFPNKNKLDIIDCIHMFFSLEFMFFSISKFLFKSISIIILTPI